jgi:hypothetical protein
VSPDGVDQTKCYSSTTESASDRAVYNNYYLAEVQLGFDDDDQRQHHANNRPTESNAKPSKIRDPASFLAARIQAFEENKLE